MRVAVWEQDANQQRGIRPVDILRDLDAIGQLIDLVFADDAGHERTSLQRDLALLTAASPFLWVVRRLSPEMRDAFDGFVWIEDGRVVGNVTLSRDDPDRDLWTISNVAVYPAYRRRGIARALMEACLNAVAERGGGRVQLEVRADNTAAYNLYLSLGFRFVDGQVTARLPGRLARQLRRVHDDSPARVVGYDEGDKLFALARAAHSALAQQISPIRDEDYRPRLLYRLTRHIMDVLTHERHVWLALEEDRRFLAAARLCRRGTTESSAELLIHPDGRQRVESLIIDGVLAACGPVDQGITFQVSSGEQKAVAILREYGFAVVRDLHRMMIEVEPAPDVQAFMSGGDDSSSAADRGRKEKWQILLSSDMKQHLTSATAPS